MHNFFYTFFLTYDNCNVKEDGKALYLLGPKYLKPCFPVYNFVFG